MDCYSACVLLLHACCLGRWSSSERLFNSCRRHLYEEGDEKAPSKPDIDSANGAGTSCAPDEDALELTATSGSSSRPAQSAVELELTSAPSSVRQAGSSAAANGTAKLVARRASAGDPAADQAHVQIHVGGASDDDQVHLIQQQVPSVQVRGP
jgi:hypothetical protein